MRRSAIAHSIAANRGRCVENEAVQLDRRPSPSSTYLDLERAHPIGEHDRSHESQHRSGLAVATSGQLPFLCSSLAFEDPTNSCLERSVGSPIEVFGCLSDIQDRPRRKILSELPALLAKVE